MRLQDKFKRVFILPLICGIILSILLTVVILLLYSNQFSDPDLVSRLSSVESDKTLPIIQTTKNLLYKKFQQNIYSIQLFKSYYKFYSENSNIINETDQTVLNLITNYSFNGIDLFKKNSSRYNSSNNDSRFDFGAWHYSNETENLSAVQNKLNNSDYKLFINQMNILTSMIQVFRSIFEVSMDNESSKIDLIYFGSIVTKLFYTYPVNDDNINNFYKSFNNFKNPSYCKDVNGITPIYYYFECRDWYQETLNYYDGTSNTSILITHPYKFAQKPSGFGISICIIFNDSISIVDNKKDNSVIFCIDLNLTETMVAFDHFNKQLSGYFFILRVKTDIPLYYPMVTKLNYFSNIQRFEFDLNVTYFVDELLQFERIVKENFTNQMEEENTPDIITNVNNSTYKNIYFKNGEQHNFTIYPLRLFIDPDDLNQPIHILSVIYISKDSIFVDSLKKSQIDLIPRLTIQIFLFVIMGAILMLVAWYLIISIAQNIIKPIKNLKNLIKGMNSEIKKFDQEDKTTENEEEEEEVDEDTIDVRSVEIENLFNILLKLKHVLSFTSNTKVIHQNSALINYVNAKFTFQEVSNDRGKKLCDSNAGNLALKCNKYDKAILHLLDAIPPIKEKDKSSTNNYKSSDSENNNKNLEDSGSELKPLINNGNSKKTILLESRYPKLIYSYKKFFKSMKRLMKSKEFYKDVAEIDILTQKDSHSLEKYEKVLTEYKLISEGDDRRVAESILEYNEFLIKYKLKVSSSNNNNDLVTISEDIKHEKLIIFDLIVKNFEEFDKKLENLKASNSAEYFKNYLEILKNNKKENFDLIIETPSMILCQRCNYLKGKFSRYCGHNVKALDFFFKSRETQIICDASIIKKSINQIIKIMREINDEIENNIQQLEYLNKTDKNEMRSSRSNQTRAKIDQNKKISDTIIKYIENMEKEVDQFNLSQPKDLIVLIDFSETMSSCEGKKIKNAIKTSQNILDNYITQEDKFGLFLYTKSLNPIVSLTNKNMKTYNYIKDLMEELIIDYVDHEFKGKTNLINSLELIHEYLKKKSKGGREKFIIVFTDSFNSKKDIFMETMLNFKDNSKGIFNIVVVGMNMEKESAQILEKTLENNNKSCYLDFENIGKLKNVLKIMGTVKEEINFQNERYEADKKGE